MFGFGRRKQQPQPEEQHTLKLPLIKSMDFTAEKIADYLRNGTPILTVFDPVKKPEVNFNMLLGVERNGLSPSVSMYRKEGSLLYNYQAYQYNGDNQLHFMLYSVYEFKNSNIMELCNSDFKEAYELYHDDENIIESQLYYSHDFTEEEGIEYFKTHPKERSLYIGRERCIKRKKNNESPTGTAPQ